MRGWRCAMAGLVAIVVLSSLMAAVLATPAVGQAPATAGLKGLGRVAIEVTLAPDHPGVIPAELERRLDATLRAAQPAPHVDRRSPDVLRLAVAVRRVSTTELRGYYLPFSGSYGLGSVRLAVVRAVAVPGVAGPVGAVVWQAERLAHAPWRRSGAEIAGLLDELVTAFLEDYRQAVGP